MHTAAESSLSLQWPTRLGRGEMISEAAVQGRKMSPLRESHILHR